MNFWKSLVLCTFLMIVIVGLPFVASPQKAAEPTESSLLSQIVAVLSFIGLCAFLAFLVTGWAYAAFLLIDSDSILYQIFAVVMTGLFGICVLLGIRWGYRKVGLTVLD